MRWSMKNVVLIAVWTLIAQLGVAQSPPNVTALLRSAYAAEAGPQSVQDANLSGTVEYIAGADYETVPIHLESISSGSARTDISLTAGTLTETRQVLPSSVTGAWSIAGNPP